MAQTQIYYDSPLTGEELDAAFRKIPQIDACAEAAAASQKAAAASETNAAASKTAAASSASAAAASAQAATASQSSAASDATAAAASQKAAAASETNAAASKTAAASSASAAAASQKAAATSESNAAASKTAAAASATLAQSWAEGGTGTRTGEDTDNAKYWCNKAQQATQFDPDDYYTKAQADARYRMPVGYIFDWAPVEGQSIDLSTPEKVAAHFGYGTWKELTGVFTFGHDDDHEVGTTGGETEHTLTTPEIPAHTHSITPAVKNEGNSLLGSGTKPCLTGASSVSVTGSAGGGLPHNNMPPYMSVYKWQRIA